MGLDVTIRREDGMLMGTVEDVQAALQAVFQTIEFGLLPSGPEKIADAAAQGIVYPDVIRKPFETQPASVGGAFESEDFTADFFLGCDDMVAEVGVVLYAAT